MKRFSAFVFLFAVVFNVQAAVDSYRCVSKNSDKVIVRTISFKNCELTGSTKFDVCKLGLLKGKMLVSVNPLDSLHMKNGKVREYSCREHDSSTRPGEVRTQQAPERQDSPPTGGTTTTSGQAPRRHADGPGHGGSNFRGRGAGIIGNEEI